MSPSVIKPTSLRDSSTTSAMSRLPRSSAVIASRIVPDSGTVAWSRLWPGVVTAPDSGRARFPCQLQAAKVTALSIYEELRALDDLDEPRTLRFASTGLPLWPYVRWIAFSAAADHVLGLQPAFATGVAQTLRQR